MEYTTTICFILAFRQSAVSRISNTRGPNLERQKAISSGMAGVMAQPGVENERWYLDGCGNNGHEPENRLASI